MKIAFLDPCEQDFYQNKPGSPLGIAYIASYLENKLDQEFDMSIYVDVNRVLKEKPDIVGISAYTETFQRAINAAQKIKKELDIPVIIGGKHITALPSNLKSCFDVGVVGDGEITMSELVSTYLNHGSFLPEELEKIDGIVFRDNENLFITKQREPLKDLDFLPPPKRSILNTYWPDSNEKWDWPQAIFTSRGCPYKCPFCIHSKIQFVTRYHTPERVVKEICDIIAKYPNQKNITIHDDLFAISKKRLRAIVDLIKSEKINRKVSFTCMCKSNLFDEEIAFMLKEMNVNFIAFGFESGDEKTLQYLKKDSSKIVENIQAINLCQKYGIQTAGYFIIGSPVETKEGLTKTYWFIRQNYPPMSVTGIFCLTPFPGTKTWDDALQKGLVNPETENWENYNYLSYQKDKMIFINDNYDFDFYRDAFKNHFLEIHNKSRVYANRKTEEWYDSYYQKIFQHLKHYDIKFDSEILEVGTYFNTSIKEYFVEEKEITRFDHWIYFSPEDKQKEYNYQILGNKQFDLIVFNHCLEQMLNPLEKLEYFIDNFLNKKGKAIILVKNPLFVREIIALLLGRSEIYKSGFKTFDSFEQTNIKKIKDLIERKNFKLKEISIKGDISPYKEAYISLFPVIDKYININNFIENSYIENFLFIIEK